MDGWIITVLNSFGAAGIGYKPWLLHRVRCREVLDIFLDLTSKKRFHCIIWLAVGGSPAVGQLATRFRQ